MQPEITIGNRRIGPGQPCFVIAEAGVNHNGEGARAEALIAAAVAAGADAVKFQTFKTEQVIAPNTAKAPYQQASTGTEENMFEMVKKLELSFDEFRHLAELCRQQGIMFLSTPFDHDSVDFLASLGMAAFKVPSGEITNFPLVTHIARQGRPLIISTGMSTIGEADAVLQCAARAGNKQAALLHCVSNYPADPAETNLRVLETLGRAFGIPVGFSDHTLGIEVAMAAVALGASIIEKHFTLDCNLPGPDHRASLEPDQLRALIQGIRKVESALGNGIKTPSAAELAVAAVGRRSLVAGQDLAAGTRLSADMVAVLRPGTGIPPAALEYVLGRELKQAVRAGELLRLDHFA
jgi:N,N'-diacetyllegionaminate synthase